MKTFTRPGVLKFTTDKFRLNSASTEAHVSLFVSLLIKHKIGSSRDLSLAARTQLYLRSFNRVSCNLDLDSL